MPLLQQAITATVPHPAQAITDD